MSSWTSSGCCFRYFEKSQITRALARSSIRPTRSPEGFGEVGNGLCGRARVVGGQKRPGGAHLRRGAMQLALAVAEIEARHSAGCRFRVLRHP